MRNKKLLSTVVASALVATMAMPVMAAEGGNFDVNVTLKDAVIRVAVPTTLEIAVNQFEINDSGSQITSGNFNIDNKSEVAVKVDVTSTVTLGSSVKLASGLNAVKESKEANGEAWLAVAARTAADSYNNDTDKGVDKLTETSANVATFAKDETDTTNNKGKVSQTFYLNKGTGSKTYKMITTSSTVKAADIAYARFYSLTDKTSDITATSGSEVEEMKKILQTTDLYEEASGANGALTPIAKGTSTPSYTNGSKYYTASDTAVDGKTADQTAGPYVYGEAGDGEGTEFRYIGKLSESKETWTTTDINKINIAYTITGVTDTKYKEIKDAGELTYGLYKEKPKNVGPSIAVTKYEYDKTAPLTITTDFGSGTSAATSITSVKTGTSETSFGADVTTDCTISGNIITFPAGKFAPVAAGDKRYLEVTFSTGDKVPLELTIK